MTSTVLSIPVLAMTPFGLAWIWTRIRRVRPTKEEIMNKIHKGELDKIKEYAPRDLTRDVLKTDKDFWDCMGGFSGLLRKRENAVCCVHLLQWYVHFSNMDKEDVDYVSQRCFRIAFLTLASIPEEFIRLVWWGMPHFCARWIAQLYWELATQTQMFNLEYGDEQLAL